MAGESPTLTVTEALKKAGKLAARGDTQAARQLYDSILRREPGNKKAKKGLSALQRQGKLSLTEADFARITNLLRRGRSAAALAEAERLCRLFPQQPALHNLRGVILTQQGSLRAAAAALREALDLEPGFSDAAFNLASVFTDLGRLDEAQTGFEQLIDRGQGSAEVHNGLGRALRAAGKTGKAMDAYQQAIALRPTYAEAFLNLGNAQIDAGQHDKALQSYSQALQLKPELDLALVNLVETLLPLRRPAEALEVLASRRLKDTPRALRLRGRALLALDQRHAARECYEELLNMNAQDSVARHLIAALSGTRHEYGDPAYARTVFNDLAPRYEARMRQLAYTLPERLPGLLQALDGENAWFETVLDLGCGTGLAGSQLRPYCSELLGVDVAGAMIDRAAEKAVYDELVVADAESWLRGTARRFDLVVCADVAAYIGGLDRLMQSVVARMNDGARLILSTERSDEDSFELQVNGRYKHSADYIEQCAAQSGVRVASRGSFQLRSESGSTLDGELFVIARA
ncbi:MAG: tetratricopeptide repeat protein [Pseudomonadota bacterium]